MLGDLIKRPISGSLAPAVIKSYDDGTRVTWSYELLAQGPVRSLRACRKITSDSHESAHFIQLLVQVVGARFGKLVEHVQAT